MMGKKIILGLMVLALLFALSPGLLASADIYIDGRRISPEVGPVEIGGEIYVPLEDITDYLRIDLRWNIRGDQVGGQIDGQNFTISRPVLIHGYLMVNLGFVEQYLDLYTYWDPRGERIDMDKKDPEPPKTIIREEIMIRVDTDRSSYRYGDYIAVSLVIFNNSSSSRNLEFNTGQTFDLIMKRGGRVVWQWSQDKAFTQAFQTKTMEPYEIWQETFLIPSDAIRTFVSGNYTLEGRLTTYPQPISSEELSIRVSR